MSATIKPKRKTLRRDGTKPPAGWRPQTIEPPPGAVETFRKELARQATAAAPRSRANASPTAEANATPTATAETWPNFSHANRHEVGEALKDMAFLARLYTWYISDPDRTYEDVASLISVSSRTVYLAFKRYRQAHTALVVQGVGSTAVLASGWPLDQSPQSGVVNGLLGEIQERVNRLRELGYTVQVTMTM